MVRPVEPEEIAQAGRLLARAFHEGPLGRLVVPEESDRARLWPKLFEALVRSDHLYGEAERLDDFWAVTTWLPPGEEEATAEKLHRAGWDDLPAELPLESIGQILGAIVSAVRSAAPEPHWHLRLLAVDPDRQGRGLGSALLEHGLRRAQRGGRPVPCSRRSTREPSPSISATGSRWPSRTSSPAAAFATGDSVVR